MSNEEINKNMSEVIKAKVSKIQNVVVLKETEKKIKFEANILRTGKVYLFKGFFDWNFEEVEKTSCYDSNSYAKRETKINVTDEFKDILREHFINRELKNANYEEGLFQAFEEVPPVPKINTELIDELKKQHENIFLNPVFSVSLVYKEGEVIKLYAIIVKDANNKEEALGKAFFYFREQTEYLSLIANIVIEIED
jgi:hypothetical protein